MKLELLIEQTITMDELRGERDRLRIACDEAIRQYARVYADLIAAKNRIAELEAKR